MAPIEFESALKDIKRTRNLLIFIGWIPVLYFSGLIIVAPLFDLLSLTQEIILGLAVETLISLIVIAVFVMNAINTSRYLNRISKIGLIIGAIGVLMITLVMLLDILGVKMEILDILSYIGPISICLGFVLFMFFAEIGSSQKMMQILYYPLMILSFFSMIDSYRDINYTPLVVFYGYPIFLSYIAIKWAKSEICLLGDTDE